MKERDATYSARQARFPSTVGRASVLAGLLLLVSGVTYRLVIGELQRLDDTIGKFGFHQQCVVRGTVETFAEELPTGAHRNEFGPDPQLVAPRHDLSGEQIVGLQRLANLPRRVCTVAMAEG